jgi:hypothetical protein
VQFLSCGNDQPGNEWSRVSCWYKNIKTVNVNTISRSGRHLREAEKEGGRNDCTCFFLTIVGLCRFHQQAM